MVTPDMLESRGFRLEYSPLSAFLKMADGGVLYLRYVAGRWQLGHSGKKGVVQMRPGGRERFQYVESAEDLDLEIEWVRRYGTERAVAISESLSVLFGEWRRTEGWLAGCRGTICLSLN